MPSTLAVTNNLDTGVAGDGSLRGEIAAAKNNDTIVFDPSLSGQTIGLFGDGELVINKNLTIHGPSAPLSSVSISGGGFSRVFEVDGTNTIVSLSNLNLIYGNGWSGNPVITLNGQGGAIWNGGTLTVSGCNLSNNHANNGILGLGGAIYNAGTLTVRNSTLDNNSVYLGGAIYRDGGAIYNAGTLTISNSTLDDNTAGRSGDAGYGGGVFNAYRASAIITGSRLSGNIAGGSFSDVGDGIYNDGTMALSGSIVSGNSGDGIVNDKKGHLAITSKSSVVSNSGYDLYNLGAVKISTDSDVGVIGK